MQEKDIENIEQKNKNLTFKDIVNDSKKQKLKDKNYNKEKYIEEKQEKISKMTKQIEKGVKEVFESKAYKDYLDVMKKFHNYSFNNQMLIYMQKSNATLIKGYVGWKKDFERSIKKGEKAIYIFSPYEVKVSVEVVKKDEKGNPIKDKNGNEITEIQKQLQSAVRFKLTPVFDISQTEGKEIDELNLFKELKFNVENFDSFFKAIEEISPVPIQIKLIENSQLKGFYSLKENEITIKENMSQAHTIKTAIHEVTHAMLHTKEKIDERTREVQAESIAYVVCSYFSIDTSEYSFPYLANWSKGKEMEELKNSLDIIQKTSSKIINKMEEILKKDLKKEKEVKLGNNKEISIKESLQKSSKLSNKKNSKKEVSKDVRL